MSGRIPRLTLEQLDPRLAETLGAEFGGTTVLVDPLGDPETPERSTYPGLMRFNARAFFRAMSRIDADDRIGTPETPAAPHSEDEQEASK